MKLRKGRAFRKGRIEIIPMIDVMFFLLATFMLASLSMQNLHSVPVNLPQGRAAPIQAHAPITLTVTHEGHLLLDSTPVTLESLASRLKPLLRDPETRIIVAADSGSQHGLVVRAMLQARAAGALHFLFAVKREG